MASKLNAPRRPWEPKANPRKPQEGRKEKTGFYSSAAWIKLRNCYRMNNPLCEECNRNGKVVHMKIVDHIRPIREGGEPLDYNNLQSLCDSCHNAKSGRERRNK